MLRLKLCVKEWPSTVRPTSVPRCFSTGNSWTHCHFHFAPQSVKQGMRLSRSVSLVATISSSSPLSCALSRFVSTSRGGGGAGDDAPLWRHVTVEWSPKLSQQIQSQPDLQGAATHWVFPDLPLLYTREHRVTYWQSIAPPQRIQTVAACHHSDWKSLVATAKERWHGMTDQGDSHDIQHGGKLLLVGGNDKTAQTMSTVQAATILQSELFGDKPAELWAVADPNDPESVANVQSKVEAGIVGFLTQPPLSSTAWDTIESYRNHNHKNISIVVGMALPKSAASLQFWRQLLNRPELVEKDPLFQSHLAYFSQPYTTSLAWIGRELQECITSASIIDGVHFMPLHNTKDMMALLQTLAVQKRPQP